MCDICNLLIRKKQNRLNMKFHVQKWNKRDKEYTMIILTEEDVQKECRKKLVGAGYEILVLPSKYEYVHTTYLDTTRFMATARGGEIIYV